MGTPNDAGDEVKVQNLPQNEIALANLRDEAMQALAGGKPFSTSSTADKEGNALHVSTTGAGGKPDGLMIIDGSNTNTGYLISEKLEGNYNVFHDSAAGHSVEHDKFTINASNIDSLWGRDDKANLSLERRDAAGRPIQTYEPAISEPKLVNGHIALDANSNEMRVARPADGDANSQLENIGNPNNHRRETDYIVHDAALAKKLGVSGDAISLNLTFEDSPNFSQKGGEAIHYRGVVRTLDGERVLGIIEQDAKLDAKGSLTDVQTSSRLPHKPK
jgi:hypothetical protein